MSRSVRSIQCSPGVFMAFMNWNKIAKSIVAAVPYPFSVVQFGVGVRQHCHPVSTGAPPLAYTAGGDMTLPRDHTVYSY